MPCYTQQTSVVQFGAQTDRALLQRALEGLGFIVRKTERGLSFQKAGQDGSFENGALTVNGTVEVNAFKRAYSAEVVRAAGARFGWQVKQSAPSTFQVTRRM